MQKPTRKYNRFLKVFVATRREDVPLPEDALFASVDGSVPGATLTWDHHVTGHRINLDAMPPVIDLPSVAEIEGVGTTNADTDAVASVAALVFGGSSAFSDRTKAILESASHWCDHLRPHPLWPDYVNELGKGLNWYISSKFDVPRDQKSRVFAEVCEEICVCIEEGKDLPFEAQSPFQDLQQKLVERKAISHGPKIQGKSPVALVDLRGMPGMSPIVYYELIEAPVAVAVNERDDGGVQYTVGVNPRCEDAPVSIRGALEVLKVVEATLGKQAESLGTWGGRDTVFGSPWNYGSALQPEQVAAIVTHALFGA